MPYYYDYYYYRTTVLEALRELGARRAAERGEHQPRREGGAPA